MEAADSTMVKQWSSFGQTLTHLHDCRKHWPVDVLWVDGHLVVKAAEESWLRLRCTTHRHNITLTKHRCLQQAVQQHGLCQKKAAAAAAAARRQQQQHRPDQARLPVIGRAATRALQKHQQHTVSIHAIYSCAAYLVRQQKSQTITA
jgi:hypothetical protein